MRSLICTLFALLLLSAPASAQTAASANSYITPQKIGAIKPVSLAGAPGVSYVDLYVGGTTGSKCFGGVLAHNDQTLAHTLTFRLLMGTPTPAPIDYLAYTTVPAGAANSLSVPINIMSTVFTGNSALFPIDAASGNQYFYLNAGDKWQIQWTGTITVNDSIAILPICEDFK